MDVQAGLCCSHLSRVFCICDNKGADQLHGNRTADQRLCFRYIGHTVPLSKSEISSLVICTAQFVSGLGRNPEDRFSRIGAHGLDSLENKEKTNEKDICKRPMFFHHFIWVAYLYENRSKN